MANRTANGEILHRRQAFWVSRAAAESMAGQDWTMVIILNPLPPPIPTGQPTAYSVVLSRRQPFWAAKAAIESLAGQDWTQFIVLSAFNPHNGNSQDMDAQQSKTEGFSLAAIGQAEQEGTTAWTQFIIIPAFNPHNGNSQDMDAQQSKTEPFSLAAVAQSVEEGTTAWIQFIILPPFQSWMADEWNMFNQAVNNGAQLFYTQEDVVNPPIQPSVPATGRSVRLGLMFPSFR